MSAKAEFANEALVVVNTIESGITITRDQKGHLIYYIDGFDTATNEGIAAESFGTPVKLNMTMLPFQSSRPKEGEVPNGLTDDVLLAILEDRLRAYDNSLAKNQQNTEALLHVQIARGLVKQRGMNTNVPQ